MKKLLILLVFTFSNVLFSQTEPKKFKDKFAEFDYYAKPDKTNDLSKYFKRNIDYALLENYKFKDTLRRNSAVVLTFKLNWFKIDKYKAYQIEVSSSSPELNYVIEKAFQSYDIYKIDIPDKNPLNQYTLQILSKEGNQMVVNCSSNIIYDRFPVYKPCETSLDFSNNRYCIKAFLEEHFAKNISLDFLKKRKITGSLKLSPEFIVNENGTVEMVKWKRATDSLTIETHRILALFPKAKVPPTRNGNPTQQYFKENITLEINAENKNYVESAIKNKKKSLDPNCELALHFKKYISEETINKIEKPVQSSDAFVKFSVDKTGKMIDLSATSFEENLDNKLVDIFKKFPFEKLNIKDPNVLETYYYDIFTVEYDSKVIIRCNENPKISTEVYFDKECEKSGSVKELEKCFQEKVGDKITKNFDLNLINKTDLGTKKELLFIVQVDTDGTISRVNRLITNPTYAYELDRIIKELPKVYKVGYWEGMPTKKNYYIKLSF